MIKRIGDTIFFENRPFVRSFATIVGKKEGEGPLANGFDEILADNYAGESCWETAESTLQRRAVKLCLKKQGLKPADIDIAFAGDLQAQCTASNYAMRELGMPFVGLYGACSTMAESLALSAIFCASGAAEKAIATTSSHFCSAEREFRTPLDYGGKRTPSAQWTATAAGAVLLEDCNSKTHVQHWNKNDKAFQPEINSASKRHLQYVSNNGEKQIDICSATFGRVQDFSVKDINNMGAAMCPAAVSTLCQYFSDSGTTPQDFDAIFTGDLGAYGTALFREVMANEGFTLENHHDCGLLLFDRAKQAVDAGGSGAGCSACVLGSYILPKLQSGEFERVLFIATGALMSQTSFLQGESIPAIAHLVELISI